MPRSEASYPTFLGYETPSGELDGQTAYGTGREMSTFMLVSLARPLRA
jgi:hypothetical protein